MHTHIANQNVFFMFVGAAVSEMRKSNQNKEKKKNLQNATFPGHIYN